MDTRYLLLFITTLNVVYSASLGFAVVAVGGSDVSVKIGTNTYPMTRVYSDIDYFQVIVDVASTPFTYKYSMNGSDESFDRTFATSQGSQTYNEFFGRQETVKTLYQMGYPFTDKQKWTRKLGPNGVYDDDYISTVFISGGNSSNTANACFSVDGTNCYGTFTTTIISKYDVGRSTSTQISSKAGYEPKIQMNLYVNSYRGRWAYKLRPSCYDVSMVRERIYNDVLESAGCPHQETSFTRVYVGSKPLGLYYLQEITGSGDFIQTQFYGQSWSSDIGGIYECSTGADFYNPNGIYNFGLVNPGDKFALADKSDLKALINKVESLDFSSDSEIASFSTNWLDLDYYLRAVAIEFLTGNWDGYLFYTSNYVMYRNPQEGTTGTYKFYFVDQDFDQTFGVSISANDDMEGYSASNMLPYTTFVGKTWNNGGAPSRKLFDGLMSNANQKAKFETILKTLVKSVFNPIALGKRISEVKARIDAEVKWDRELGANRIRQGCVQANGCNSPDGQYQGYQYSYAEFISSFNSSVRGDAGLYTWVTKRAEAIQTQLGAGAYDNPPLSGTPNYGTSSGQVFTTAPATTTSTSSTGTGTNGTSTTGTGNNGTTTGTGNNGTTTGTGNNGTTTGATTDGSANTTSGDASTTGAVSTGVSTASTTNVGTSGDQGTTTISLTTSVLVTPTTGAVINNEVSSASKVACGIVALAALALF